MIYSNSIRKNIILHEEKAIAHLVQQPNQSRYIENLILNDLISSEFNDIFLHLRNLKQQFNNLPDNQNLNSHQNIQEIQSDIQNSISNILALT